MAIVSCLVTVAAKAPVLSKTSEVREEENMSERWKGMGGIPSKTTEAVRMASSTLNWLYTSPGYSYV